MSEHCAVIKWSRESEDFDYKSYNREHSWIFDNGMTIQASAAVDYLGKFEYLDPEQAYVASLSSCHMLTFLAIASQKGLSLESYTDNAVGHLEKNEAGRMAIARLVLSPKVVFSDGVDVSEEQLTKMHDMAHKNCFIANSVTTKISVEHRF